jgi:holo-[acyl-carrier protein] synthase
VPSVPESAHAGVVGVGVDLVEVDRMRDTLARTPTIVERVFTADEAAWARAAKDPSERFAVRFAAKEAVLKSLGVGLGSTPLRAIEVVRADSGEPSIVLHEPAAALAAQRGVVRFHVSLTHTASLAAAVVVASGD